MVLATFAADGRKNLRVGTVGIDLDTLNTTRLEDVATRFTAVSVTADRLDAARAEKPFYERQILGRVVMYFENTDPAKLQALGEIHTPSVADLFVAKLSGGAA